MPTEADTCRKFVLPKFQAVGWDNDPHSIAEQRFFTKGRIIVRGKQAERRKGRRADWGEGKGEGERAAEIFETSEFCKNLKAYDKVWGGSQ